MPNFLARAHDRHMFFILARASLTVALSPRELWPSYRANCMYLSVATPSRGRARAQPSTSISSPADLRTQPHKPTLPPGPPLPAAQKATLLAAPAPLPPAAPPPVLELFQLEDTCFHTYTNVPALKRRQRASLTA